jgi:NAD(P)-dependent dehydrogenase (short-subunit alcohol dehydrogenase family)
MSDEYLRKLFSLEGQVVVVIGGTGVLGGGLALSIAQAGAMVIVAGRDAERKIWWPPSNAGQK